jgi:hypothetical protein
MKPVAFVIVSQKRAGFFLSKTAAFVWREHAFGKFRGSVDRAISQSQGRQESKGDQL